MFINDLAMHMKHLNSGIHIGLNKSNVLLYADCIELIAENEGDMNYTTSYKYLGVLFYEFATFENNTEISLNLMYVH